MSSTRERPLGQVLARALCDFTPEHPERPPWLQPSGISPELAATGNRAVVNLKIADRVQLHGLDVPSWERDDLEPWDWMPVGWGVGPTPT